MKKIIYFVIYTILTFSVENAMSDEIVVVAPEPFINAWWLRTTFRAVGNNISEFPLSEIDSDLRKASSYTFDIFPESIKYKERMPLQRLMNWKNLSFTLHMHPSKGAEVVVSVGVYESHSGEAGNFVFFNNKGLREHRIEKYPGKPVLFMLNKINEEEFLVWENWGFKENSLFKWNVESNMFIEIEPEKKL